MMDTGIMVSYMVRVNTLGQMEVYMRAISKIYRNMAGES
jgi:hypothetical protein